MLDVEREREKEAKDRSSSTNWKGSRLKHSFSFSPFLEPNFPSFVRGKREINAFDKSKIIIDELKTFPFFQTIPEEKSETRFRQVDLFIDDTELFIDEEDAKMGGDDFAIQVFFSLLSKGQIIPEGGISIERHEREGQCKLAKRVVEEHTRGEG